MLSDPAYERPDFSDALPLAPCPISKLPDELLTGVLACLDDDLNDAVYEYDERDASEADHFVRTNVREVCVRFNQAVLRSAILWHRLPAYGERRADDMNRHLARFPESSLDVRARYHSGECTLERAKDLTSFFEQLSRPNVKARLRRLHVTLVVEDGPATRRLKAAWSGLLCGEPMSNLAALTVVGTLPTDVRQQCRMPSLKHLSARRFPSVGSVLNALQFQDLARLSLSLLPNWNDLDLLTTLQAMSALRHLTLDCAARLLGRALDAAEGADNRVIQLIQLARLELRAPATTVHRILNLLVAPELVEVVLEVTCQGAAPHASAEAQSCYQAMLDMLSSVLSRRRRRRGSPELAQIGSLTLRPRGLEIRPGPTYPAAHSEALLCGIACGSGNPGICRSGCKLALVDLLLSAGTVCAMIPGLSSLIFDLNPTVHDIEAWVRSLSRVESVRLLVLPMRSGRSYVELLNKMRFHDALPHLETIAFEGRAPARLEAEAARNLLLRSNALSDAPHIAWFRMDRWDSEGTGSRLVPIPTGVEARVGRLSRDMITLSVIKS
ncbi:unnamed protein product [Peniophora sp. CBMAI 1063]|nr:unnamed protein product [Peniophora sp. CBMAI 1063]